MKNRIETGDQLSFAAPSTIVSGTPTKVGNIVGVALGNYGTNEDALIATVGVYSLPKTAEAISVGDLLYLDGTQVTPTATPIVVGLAWANADAGAAEVAVSLVRLPANMPVASEKVVQVRSLADLPAPVGGVITIPTGYTYKANTFIDLQGNRLFVENEAMLDGYSSETSGYYSQLATGEALVSGDGTFPCQNIRLWVEPSGVGEEPQVLDFDCTANQAEAALDWYGVNIVNSNIGVLKNFSNFVAINCAFIGAKDGLDLQGSFDSAVVFNSIFRNTQSGGTLFKVGAGVTVTRRIRIVDTPISVPSGSVGIDVSASASIPADAYILRFVNFSGAGTYLQGIQADDNRAFFFECRGIQNSASIAAWSFEGNATPTPITVQGTYYKVLGTTTSNLVRKWEKQADNEYKYVGALANTHKVTIFATFTSSANAVIGFKVAINGAVVDYSRGRATANAGGRAENVPIQCLVDATTNTVISLYVTNETGTQAVTVTDATAIHTLS